MLTIYAPVQRTHRQAYILKQGTRARSHEIPARIDSILAAIHGAELGPVVSPEDAGLAPIHAVHDEDMVTFLATAYAQHRANGQPEEPVLPTFSPPARAAAATGQL